MMKSLNAFLITIAVVSASFQMPSMGAVTVTASKNYVDRQTKVETVTNADVGVVGYTVGTNTNCVFSSTNYVDSKLGNIKTDLITDGTNTIDAAGNVFVSFRSPWTLMTNGVYAIDLFFDYSQNKWTNVLSGAMIACDYSNVNGWCIYSQDTGMELYSEADVHESALSVVFDHAYTMSRSYVYENKLVGKLALTNDIPSDPDFTTGNAQLVQTIHETAPAPGNYLAVSNAAMNARSATDLGVRGAPQGEGSWFTVDGKVLSWMGGGWSYGETFIMGHEDSYSLNAETPFTLGADFSNIVEGHIIIGYTNTLAQVSQIPTVDYTTSNTQLVATIETKAPAPGNYSAVSNAAMNARSATDLGVRGAPQGAGSWFTVNGQIVPWDAETGAWGNEKLMIDDYGGHYFFFGEDEREFYLDENFSCSINFGTNTYIVIGYTNTLAQVSQIPTVPQGVVTTNSNGVIESDIKIQTFPYRDNNHPGNTTLTIGGSGDPFMISNRIVVGSSYCGGSIRLMNGGPNWELPGIVIAGSTDDGGAIKSDAEISLNGTNILPLVFGAAQRTEISATDPTFSNAVLSVGLNIDTNTVAAINALVESGDDLPIGGATSVGAILLAIAAAIAALKRRVDDKASLADIPYELVERGEWEFSGANYNPNVRYTVTVTIDGGGTVFSYNLYGDGTWLDGYSSATNTLNVVNFSTAGVIATKTGIHLLDRAVNAVSVSAATTLTLPALVNAGKSRDLLVRLTVSADSAVTFSATTGETITWDDAGSPTATYEAGTHLLRFTEVGLDNGSHVFHFTDLGAGGSIDPAVLNGKLEATSAAPAFNATKTYSVGEHVTYEGVLYECSTAVTTAGAWTGSTNWTATDMTSPDATLDLMADGRLRLVSADGEVLWMQGYGLASASSVTLSCDKVNFYAFASGTVTQAFDMPSAPSGKVGDFVLDVDNTANASASVTATLTGEGTAFDVFTPEGVNLSTDILTFAGGEQCELYFTMTAFGTAAKPAWKVVKQIVEKQEFGS